MTARRRATYEEPIRPDWTPGEQRSPLTAVAVALLAFMSVLAALVVVMVVTR